jgi:hypothetical protein
MKRQRRPPKLNAEMIWAHFEALEENVEFVLEWLSAVDYIGDAKQLEPGSEAHGLARLRDETDRCFAHFAMKIAINLKRRAELSHDVDLLIMAAQAECGRWLPRIALDAPLPQNMR